VFLEAFLSIPGGLVGGSSVSYNFYLYPKITNVSVVDIGAVSYNFYPIPKITNVSVVDIGAVSYNFYLYPKITNVSGGT